MVNAAIGTDVDIVKGALEARSPPHIGIVALRQIENAGDIVARGKRLRAIEGNDQRHWKRLRSQPLLNLTVG